MRLIAPAAALLLALTLGPEISHAQDTVQYAGQYDGGQQSGFYNRQPGHNYNDDVINPDQTGYPLQERPLADGAPDAEPENEPAPPLGMRDLEQLVAPIALYPDGLVAQLLTASTYPLQVAQADHWLRAQGYASSEQVVAGADAQPWDPSVKAMTAFPQVLAEMNQNLNWTTELGNAYYNQPQDVLQAVQVMRRRAQAAGYLRSTPQESLSYDQGNIVLAPVNPEVVYVPAYNPWAVYGEPVTPYPGFSVLGAIGSFLGSAFGSSGIQFGLGIAMTAFAHTPWGWLGWGLNWLAQAVLFNHSNYYSHSTTVADWGLPHGGPRSYGRGPFSGRGAFVSGAFQRGTIQRGTIERGTIERGTITSNRSYERFGGYSRAGAGSGYGETRSQRFAAGRNENALAGGGRERYGRGYEGSGGSYGAISRGLQPAIARSQSKRSQGFGSQRFGESGYASNSYGRSNSLNGLSRSNRVNPGFNPSMRSDRKSDSDFRRSGFRKSSFSGSGGKGFSGSSGQKHSGGFHFGGRHAPKNHGGGKGFGHGHSSGGGHFGGHGHSGGGKHHH